MPEQRSIAPAKITVEDLLRLKRSERPAPEFWGEFEQTLRQKQLAALVEKRSWWREFAVIYGRFGRVGLPLGAAVVLTLSFVVLRDHSQTGPELPAVSPGAPARVAVTPIHQVVEPVKSGAVATPVAARAVEAPVPVPAVKNSVVAAEARQPAASRAVPSIPWLADVMDDRVEAEGLAPRVRSIAVNLAAVTPEPEVLEAAGNPFGFEERAMPAARSSRSAEVLPTAVAVTEPRRARLLAALGSSDAYAPGLAAPEHARRTVLRYLAEDGWDRSMGRLEAEGDKLSIKF